MSSNEDSNKKDESVPASDSQSAVTHTSLTDANNDEREEISENTQHVLPSTTSMGYGGITCPHAEL